MKRPILLIVMVYLILTLLISLPGLKAFGAVSLTGTRLIFDGRFAEASIGVTNRNNQPVLIQAWLSGARDEEGEPDPSGGDLPFVLTPHLSQVDGQGRQMLRLLYQGEGMPQDKESLLHLYVLEIPRRMEGKHQMSIAVRQRINVFYRPVGLEGDPAETAVRLRWTLAPDGALQVSNPTAFHAALQDLKLGGVEFRDYLLLAPGASQAFPLSAPGSRRLTFSALTDYGAPRAYCAHVNEIEPFSARWLNPTLQQQKEC
ncbi:MAG TPA: molecular chaperone [Pseudomonas sp.]|jgi:P pilus assembly chaperone PapD